MEGKCCMTLRKRKKYWNLKRESARWHSLDSLFRKMLRSWRKTDCLMNYYYYYYYYYYYLHTLPVRRNRLLHYFIILLFVLYGTMGPWDPTRNHWWFSMFNVSYPHRNFPPATRDAIFRTCDTLKKQILRLCIRCCCITAH